MDKYVETLHYIAAENGENYEVFLNYLEKVQIF